MLGRIRLSFFDRRLLNSKRFGWLLFGVDLVDVFIIGFCLSFLIILIEIAVLAHATGVMWSILMFTLGGHLLCHLVSQPVVVIEILLFFQTLYSNVRVFWHIYFFLDKI